MAAENEHELIRRAKGGDLDAYSGLVRAHQAGIRAALAARLHDVSMADDLAQEAFLIAFDKLGTFDEQRAFGGWIRGIAINCFRNYLRKRKAVTIGDASVLENLVNEHIEQQLPSEGRKAELLFGALTNCVEKLKGNDRRLIERRYFERESISAITGDLGMKHSAVTMRLYRLRSVLRDCIEGSLPKEEA